MIALMIFSLPLR